MHELGRNRGSQWQNLNWTADVARRHSGCIERPRPPTGTTFGLVRTDAARSMPCAPLGPVLGGYRRRDRKLNSVGALDTYFPGHRVPGVQGGCYQEAHGASHFAPAGRRLRERIGADHEEPLVGRCENAAHLTMVSSRSNFCCTDRRLSRPNAAVLSGPRRSARPRPYVIFFRPRPPAFPAFRAISLRCAGVIFVSLALPPLRPRATAAGFFLFAMKIA